jgi:NTE family protein
MVEQFQRGRRIASGEPLPPGARRGVLVALASDMSRTAGKMEDWRAAFPEQRIYRGRDLALVPTVFDKLELGLCRALVYRGWWLAGAALAEYWPARLPDLRAIKPPPI